MAIPDHTITAHPNSQFNICVIDGEGRALRAFAEDLVRHFQQASDAGEELVVGLPSGPAAQFEIAADMINERRLSLRHVRIFSLAEYADADGRVVPASWRYSFQAILKRTFFDKLDVELQPDRSRVHFPTDHAGAYSEVIESAGGMDVCYGGVGWGGHFAFWEPDLADEYISLDEMKQAGSRLVELHSTSTMQVALSMDGNWSAVPPKAVTIGPHDLLSARHRSFWLTYGTPVEQVWQRFIARLGAHGRVSGYVPVSLLQETRCDWTMVDTVAYLDTEESGRRDS